MRRVWHIAEADSTRRMDEPGNGVRMMRERFVSPCRDQGVIETFRTDVIGNPGGSTDGGPDAFSGDRDRGFESDQMVKARVSS